MANDLRSSEKTPAFPSILLSSLCRAIRRTVLGSACACVLAAGSLRADPGPLSISFNYPGVPGFESSGTATENKSWYTTGLPLGNGKLAAMVFGAVGEEWIQFNEDTIWCGVPHDYTNPNMTPARFTSIQTKCFNGQDISTDATSYLLSTPNRLPVYECPGALRLTFPHGSYSGYVRSLNLSNATVNVSYTCDGVGYDREIFASAPSNRVIVIRLTATESSSIDLSCDFTTLQTATYTAFSLGGGTADLVMHADVTFIGDNRYTLGNDVQYDARVRLVATGGTVTTGASSISVADANAVTIYLGVVSNVKAYNDLTADYVTICSNNVANAAALGYTAVRQAQQQDYTNLFSRVVLDLGVNPGKTGLDLGYRKQRIAADPNDPNLFTLFFQMGRYMMIAGSRPGSQPLNLQGKWNDRHNLYAGWGSKMTLNINEEMNYWGAEVANLAECTEPLFDLVKDLSETGHKVAQSNYFSDGWVAHHNTDLWRNAGPVNSVDGIWPTGGAWLCQHLWWHYLYNGDTNWLATNAYPLMKGAAQFFEDFLVTHPTNTSWKVTCPSHSPEHKDPAGHANVPGPTMDNELIRDLFDNVIAASEILNVDASFRASLVNLRAYIPPDTVGSVGQLREFLSYDDGTYDLAHRHCSHLVGFFPGDEISTFYTPTLAAAAKKSVDLRGPGMSDTPWSRVWRMNFRTRLQDGYHAYRILTNVLNYQNVSTNLMFSDNTDGAWRQVDGTFGALSGIAEMFLQSQSGEVLLLPALPPAFTNGSVSGLCARGGFEVDNMSWTNGKLAGATILSKLGNTCRLRTKCPVDIKLGAEYVNAPMVLPGLYEFATIAGSNYTVIPARAAETESLAVAGSSGDTHQITTNAAFSNLRGTTYSANTAGDYVTYTLPNVPAGTYRIRVGADAGANRGQFQLACAPAGGAFTNVGPAHDTWSPTNMAYLLPIMLTTPTNMIVLWTNLVREYDCGTWESPGIGNYQFKFTVAGKNPSSSGYVLLLDYVRLTPETGSAPSNAAPTDLALSSSVVNESQPPGTLVGQLSSTDPDAGETFTYSLVAGAGDADNGSFDISGSNLVTGAAFDFETRNSYSIRVRSTDHGGLWFEEAFTISIADINESPAGISLSDMAVNENEPAGAVVGAFSTTDPDAGNTFAYALVAGAGDADNASFDISGSNLLTGAVFDFETRSSYSIRVRSTDQGGLFVESAFAISVADINEPPLAPANVSPAPSAVLQPVAPALEASAFSDPDGDGHAASQWVVRRSSDGTPVFDSGEDVAHKTAVSLPPAALEYGTEYSWQVRYEDAHGAWSEYSAATLFSTLPPALGVSPQQGAVVLFWPTNTTGFRLESATGLAAGNWSEAAPPPAPSGAWKYVTNTATGDSRFYRLIKP